MGIRSAAAWARRGLLAGVLGGLLLVSGCGSSGGSGAADSLASNAKVSDSPGRDSTYTSDTVAPGPSDSAATPTTSAGGDAPGACGIVKAADLKAAGFNGDIAEGRPGIRIEIGDEGADTDAESKDETVCEFDVTIGGHTTLPLATNVLVTISSDAAESQFNGAAAGLTAVVVNDVPGLGDKAVFTSEQQPGSTADQDDASQRLAVLKGGVFLRISVISSRTAGEKEMTALAEALVPRLG